MNPTSTPPRHLFSYAPRGRSAIVAIEVHSSDRRIPTMRCTEISTEPLFYLNNTEITNDPQTSLHQ